MLTLRTVMFFRLTFLTALLPFSRAFYDTVPLVAWSSQENALVRNLNGQASRNSPLLEGLLRSEDGELCSYDVVAVFEQPGLHATDLRTLPPNSALSARLKSARSSAQIPYVRRHTSEESTSISDLVEEFSRRCGGTLQRASVGGVIQDIQEDNAKSVLHATLPEVYGEGSWRRYRTAELEEELSHTLSQIEFKYPKYLIIYTGSLLPGSSNSFLSKRQSVSDQPFDFALAPSNSTVGGGILARYQLLTPGLILSLALAFFLLLPVVLLGIQALASIQSSVRLDAPKGVSQGKKNQ